MLNLCCDVKITDGETSASFGSDGTMLDCRYVNFGSLGGGGRLKKRLIRCCLLL